MAEIERTLVLFKPDAVQRGLVGEILTRFERVGLKIVATKMISPDREYYYKHYEEIGKLGTRRGEFALNLNLDFMLMGPVIAMVFEGVEAIAMTRKIVGTTEPKEALPGTIRGDYSHISFEYANAEPAKGIPNLIHASGDAEDAAQEIAHWFKPSEIYSYEAVHEKYTR
jgi:nucleoside-diphosphate kinase